MNKRSYEEPFKLDMDFNEALARIGQTDSKEVEASIAAESESDQVRLVAEDDTGDRFLIYGTDDGGKIDLRYERDTFWATQKQMAAMFGVDVRTVSEHLKNVFTEGELVEDSVVRKSRITAADGKQYKTSLYDLNAVISVGYRVGSKHGTRFRIWATDKLFQILTKGFYVDVERLKSPDLPHDRVSELRDIIRDIRASETNAYREVRQLCAMCEDYDPKSGEWRGFFARMQNKLFWATVQMVAIQLRFERANSDAANMGLVSWAKTRIIQKDAMIAKNYLGEGEVRRMNRLTVMLLDFIEDQLDENRIATMVEMEGALDRFITNNDRPALPDRLDIPTKTEADAYCKAQYDRFKELRAMQEAEPDTRALP